MSQSIVSFRPPLQPADSLVNYRKSRYQGDDFCLAMHDFASADQSIITETYHFLESLFAVLKPQHWQGSVETLEAARSFVAGTDALTLLHSVRTLGTATLCSRSDEPMAKTLHDLRGGALSALVGELQLTEIRPPNVAQFRRLFFLTRDHLKIMRNALLGLDDPKRQADLVPKMHSVDLIVEKWQHSLLASTDPQTRLEVTCDFHGNIAECCVEFAALDRVLYNLINNACRHTVTDEVKLTIQAQPAGSEDPDNLWFCVSNPIDTDDERKLAGHANLNDLFKPGVSNTGSGFGMTIALDFVVNAFGLKGRSQALDGNYLGVDYEEKEFRVWFHWPVARDV